VKLPGLFVPKPMHNEGNYIISLGKLVRWLGAQAEGLGVDIIPEFAAQDVIIEGGVVRGITIGDKGVDRHGEQTDNFAPGPEIRAKYTFFAEGCRGHIGKRLLKEFQLDKDADPQHYGIGIKELWKVDPSKHQPGLVVHGAGWPLGMGAEATGGSFLYHLEDNQVVVGLIVDLSYSNPYLSPFDEFQRFKHHPKIAEHLEGGTRLSYGARAIAKGGFNSLPKMTFPAAPCWAVRRHDGQRSRASRAATTPMKSGMLAGEAAFQAVTSGAAGGDELTGYAEAFDASWRRRSCTRRFATPSPRSGQGTARS
jgi:electron-transferring-flavoprotein dehydrogenase